MAQIQGSGGKDDVNVELNLVPFIDLMCVCITFLLVTAVWTQISMIELGTSIHSPQTSAKVPEIPQDFVAFRLDIKPSGFVVNIGLQVVHVPKVAGMYDEETLREEIVKNVREKYPSKQDVVIAMSDGLSYELLVKGMDLLMAVGFSDIGIATGEVR